MPSRSIYPQDAFEGVAFAHRNTVPGAVAHRLLMCEYVQLTTGACCSVLKYELFTSEYTQITMSAGCSL